MLRDGLQFKDEKADVVKIYSLADKYIMNWFDIYQLAKVRLLMAKFRHNEWRYSLSRKTANNQTKEQFDAKEQVIIREAKQASAKEFLEKSKHPVVLWLLKVSEKF